MNLKDMRHKQNPSWIRLAIFRVFGLEGEAPVATMEWAMPRGVNFPT